MKEQSKHVCNTISLFGDWCAIIGLSVRFAVSFLIYHSRVIMFFELVFLLLHHLSIHFSIVM